MTNFRKPLLLLIILTVAYLFLWPVPTSPISWQSPPNRGFTGEFRTNHVLQSMEFLSVAPDHGPEDLAVDSSGRLYTATEGGQILRTGSDKKQFTEWVSTGGRPLGLDFDAQDNLIVADAYLGLLEIKPSGKITTLLDHVDGKPLGYADDVAVAGNGMIYFSDASSKFSAAEHGGTYPASLLDLMEHGGHGRVIAYDPDSASTKIIKSGLQFANGVALSEDQQTLLVCETGAYRIIKIWLSGKKTGHSEVVLEHLPGFPDNLSRGRDGRFWAGLPSSRNAFIDGLSEYPMMRKIVQRLPSFLRPKAVFYGHVFAFDSKGRVLASFQDPAGEYPLTTGALETDGGVFISSLQAASVGRLAPFFISFEQVQQ